MSSLVDADVEFLQLFVQGRVVGLLALQERPQVLLDVLLSLHVLLVVLQQTSMTL